jgi:hypothetical protein
VISEIVGQLKGGGRRSIGAVPKVVDQALAHRAAFLTIALERVATPKGSQDFIRIFDRQE